MLVTMRPGIKPKCTRHYTTMLPSDSGIAAEITIGAYKCDEPNCTRAYNSSQGYFDIVDAGVIVLQMEQHDCSNCGLPMYLHSFHADGTETWRCGQVGCKAAAQASTNP